MPDQLDRQLDFAQAMWRRQRPFASVSGQAIGTGRQNKENNELEGQRQEREFPAGAPPPASQPTEERSGRGERIRTSDSCVPNAVLYQAELHPDDAAGRQILKATAAVLRCAAFESAVAADRKER